MASDVELRDKFAAHAIAALIQTNKSLSTIGIVAGAPAEKDQAKAFKDAAKVAYEIADAMVAHRSSGPSIYEERGALSL